MATTSKERTLHQLLPLVKSRFISNRKFDKTSGLCRTIDSMYFRRYISNIECIKLSKLIKKQIEPSCRWIQPLPNSRGGYSVRIKLLDKLSTQTAPKAKKKSTSKSKTKSRPKTKTKS